MTLGCASPGPPSVQISWGSASPALSASGISPDGQHGLVNPSQVLRVRQMGVGRRERQLFVPQRFPGVHQPPKPQFANLHSGNNNNTTNGTRLAHPVEVSGQWLLIDIIASQVLCCLRALGWAG